jgi:hypothetical protein
MKTEDKIPDLIIEKLLLDELPDDFSESKKQALLENPYVIKRMEELKRSNEEILNTYPAGKTVENIKLRLKNESNVIRFDNQERKRKNFSKFLYTLSAAAVLMAALAFTYIFNNQFVPGNTAETTRIKGSTELRIYKKLNDDTVKLTDNSTVHENDRLQLRYIAVEKEYGMIFSIDGNGYITIHYPENILANNSAKLDNSGKEVYIANSYLLDDAPEFERFFFITSDTEFTEELVRESAEKLFSEPDKGINDKLDLPDDFEQHSILLKKEF